MTKANNVLGLLFEGSDPSAALLVNGEIVAFAEEERFNRQKHAPNQFPSNAIAYCLSVAKLDIADLDIIATGWDVDKFPDEMARFYLSSWYRYRPTGKHVLDWQLKNLGRYSRERMEDIIRKNLFQNLPKNRQPELRFVNHHLSHAHSCHVLSGFQDAAILTMDGHGEHDCTNFWVAEQGYVKHLKRWELPHSLGWFYTMFTQWFGFRPHDGEGKLMGLAAYGQKKDELLTNVRKVLHLVDSDSCYEVCSDFFYGKRSEDGPYSEEWLRLFGKPRFFESNDPFSQYEKDLAFAVQSVFEEVCLKLAKTLIDLTGKTKLCVAGGSFMNCKMNGVLAKWIGYENFFVQPAAGDNGISLGAALAACRYEDRIRKASFSHPYLGPEYDNATIETALIEAGLAYEKKENIAKEVAQLLSRSKIVGWFQGRMEMGARALGNRSILANPLNPDMSNIINCKVKFREPWRPFCPSTTIENGAEYFDFFGPLPYMIVACKARTGIKEKLPSVVHVDNTVRVQTVEAKCNPKYHALIEEFGKLSGYEVVLNTSFNVRGAPIVLRPEEAINCFLNTGLDYLAIGDFLVSK